MITRKNTTARPPVAPTEALTRPHTSTVRGTALRLAVAGIAAALLVGACSSKRHGLGESDFTPTATPLDRNRAVRAAEVADAAAKAAAAGEQPRGGNETSSSRILGYVNGRVISYRDVLLQVGPNLGDVVEPAERRALERQAVVEIVRGRIIKQAAKRWKVPLGRDEFDSERLRRVESLQQNGGTLDAFLAERQLTRREFDETIEDELRAEKYLLGAIGRPPPGVRVPPLADVYVSPAEVLRYWERHPEIHHQAESARVRMLVVRTDMTARDRAVARAKAESTAESIRDRLLSGEDPVPLFRELEADETEKDPHEGLIELRRGERPAWMEDFAFGSERGAVSQVIKTRTTYRVLRAEGHEEARDVPYEDVQDGLRAHIGQIKRRLATYMVEMRLLEDAAVEPPNLARAVRDALDKSRRQLQQALEE